MDDSDVDFIVRGVLNEAGLYYTSSEEDEEVTAAAGRNSSTRTKKKTVSIEKLLDERKWEEARKRLPRMTSPKRIGDILHQVLTHYNCRGIPADILKILFDKLPVDRGESTSSKGRWQMRWRYHDQNFWDFVCNYQRYNRPSSSVPKLKDVFNTHNPGSVRLILFECVKCLGKIRRDVARKIISEMWKSDIFRQSRRWGDGNYLYSDKTGEKILKYASSPHLLRSSNDMEAQKLNHLWEKTVLLVKATEGVEALEMGDEFPLIRTLLVNGICPVPKLVFWFALKVRKNEIEIADGEGRVPLHWAAKYNRYNEKRETGVVPIAHAELRELVCNPTFVEMLLKENPEAAKIRDNQGRFPLQVLLNSESKEADTEEYTLRCVEKLIQKAPEALLQADPQSRMLPFMTAASVHDEVSDDDFGRLRRGCEGRLELIYTILRSDPAVVASGIYSPKELQLMQQLEEAKLTIDRIQKENENLKKRNRELMEVNNDEDKKPAAKKSKSAKDFFGWLFYKNKQGT